MLVALVRNTTARIHSSAFEHLIEKSKKLESLQSPLVQRRDIPPLLARQMCDWVSQALKDHITRNFHFSEVRSDAALAQARQSIEASPKASAEIKAGDSARKLVEKLHTSGQLKAGFLLRVLHQNQIDLFDHAFACLLGLDLSKFRRIFYESGPRAVAMSCRAAGIDRSVFGTVFNLSRQARALSPIITPEQRLEVDMVFNALTKASATADLQADTLAAAG